ncbi:MAG: thioesterase family protein [Crocinitomicaceae bacterium]|nr:thioesterase family protein [Crocinitomicaceae bacterium]
MEPAKIQVRFADLDLMGHVNNSVYLSYFEMARVHFFAKTLGLGWDWNTQGIILVRNEIDYLKPILLHDNPLVFISVEEIGHKSFTLSYKIKVKENLVTTGKSVMVAYDSVISKSVLIPQKMREALLKNK